MGKPRPARRESLPVLPIKNTVVFPHMPVPLTVGRPRSLGAIRRALATEEKALLVITQRDPTVEQPGQGDLFAVGVRVVIKRVSPPADEGVQIVVQALERARVLETGGGEEYLEAMVEILPQPQDSAVVVEALYREVLELARRVFSLAEGGEALAEISRMMASPEDPIRLVYFLGTLLNLEVAKEQALLEADTVEQALRLVQGYLVHELQVLEMRRAIHSRAAAELTKQQREYMLRQQLRAIQQELGENEPEEAERRLLRERMEQAGLPEAVRKEVERELSRLDRLPAASPEYGVARTYVEFVLDLPWQVVTEDVLDLPRARRILDDDHYDLDDVKRRIVEHLAVMKLNPRAKAPILCFVGPPGTGKTSLGQSIARALGRKFERLSLGGMHDEAELRGHRRTYVGAMPGRILQALRRAAVGNPLVMLDEVDKLGRDFRGDPAAALLEVLDPEQNHAFRDNYLDLPFDLSRVFFITTANATETVPPPLLDRMEMLRLSGYSEEEKLQIARRYLVPRQIAAIGLTPEQLPLDDALLRHLIERYTREAGVRQLERAIGRVGRQVAVRAVEGQAAGGPVRVEDLPDMLGPERFLPEHLRRVLPAGVATGLAWTESGGDVLYIEAALLPDGKGMTLTGSLGEVMQESVKTAHSLVWSRADALGVPKQRFEKNGLHVHVPSGAIPKDGPSAGIAIAAALASLYTRRPARGDTAMTGEVTLTGLVLPIGGLKEKVLAARRAGLRRVVVPAENRKDLRELPPEVQAEMEFVFVEQVEEVLLAVIPGLAAGGGGGGETF